ncbi:hypothetical protein [Streptomyces sp. NPDC050704]|uniref:hypothetical protein n=1 Tax=Streptomyces sp. NPDC050704 TaxID=3157219 RepID=UPI003444CA75
MPFRRVTVCVLFAAGLTGCGAVDGGTRIEGRAPTGIPWSGPVYVEDGRSEPRQRPDLMDLTELTTLDRLEWRGWGSPRATATGLVLDLACLSGCPDNEPASYPVRVVLTGLVKREYAAYYGHAAVTAVRPPAPDWAEDVGSVPVHVPKA